MDEQSGDIQTFRDGDGHLCYHDEQGKLVKIEKDPVAEAALLASKEHEKRMKELESPPPPAAPTATAPAPSPETGESEAAS